MLFIDEVDATLFPCAQEKLMKFLIHWGSKLNLQIIVTTHSYNILKQAKDNDFIYNTKILYMSKCGKQIICNENPTIEQIEADLNIKVLSPRTVKKIRVYCEDAEAACFINKLLSKEQKSKISLMNKVSLGCENLKELTRKKVPEFCESIIVLDGDTKISHKNYCVLPGKNEVQKLIYNYLKLLDENDEFWDTTIGGYTKQVCFRDYTQIPENRDHFKKWFNEQLPYWGTERNLFKKWKEDNEDQVKEFQNNFQKAYEYCLNLNEK